MLVKLKRLYIKIYINLLFNKVSLCPYMARKPSLSVFSVHDRYPAVHAADLVWKCTADSLFRLVVAAILKYEGILAVFSGTFNTPEGLFHDLAFSKSQKSICFSF